jgi:hypothetical protein
VKSRLPTSVFVAKNVNSMRRDDHLTFFATKSSLLSLHWFSAGYSVMSYGNFYHRAAQRGARYRL